MHPGRVTFHFSHNQHDVTTMELRKDGHSLGMWMIADEEVSRMYDELDNELDAIRAYKKREQG